MGRKLAYFLPLARRSVLFRIRRGRFRCNVGRVGHEVAVFLLAWLTWCLAHLLGCGNGGVALRDVNRFFVSFAPIFRFALEQVAPMAMQPRGNPVVAVAPLRWRKVGGHDGPSAYANVEQVEQIGRCPFSLMLRPGVVDDEKPCLPSKAQLVGDIASALLAGADGGPRQKARRRSRWQVHPNAFRNEPGKMRLPGPVAFAVRSPKRQPARRAALADAANVPGCDVAHFGKDGIR